MTGYNPDLHHRHSIRLQGYDYSKTAAYFITVCTKDRECLFGEITDGRMVVNNVGRLIEKWWAELMNKFPLIETDIHVVMPNHFHGIIMNAVGAALCGRPDESRDQKKANHIGKGTHTGKGNHAGLPLQVPKQTSRRHERPALGNIIDWFKTMTTNEYIRGIKLHVWSSFNGKLWQRNYYEHVIRHDDDLNRVREYIMNNPIQWAFDQENPDCVEHDSKNFPKTGQTFYVGAPIKGQTGGSPPKKTIARATTRSYVGAGSPCPHWKIA